MSPNPRCPACRGHGWRRLQITEARNSGPLLVKCRCDLRSLAAMVGLVGLVFLALALLVSLAAAVWEGAGPPRAVVESML